MSVFMSHERVNECCIAACLLKEKKHMNDKKRCGSNPNFWSETDPDHNAQSFTCRYCTYIIGIGAIAPYFIMSDVLFVTDLRS